MNKLSIANLPLNTPSSPIDASININSILTDSLLIEILQRLPCISVHQAKSVCKHWLFLLSDPHFLQTFIRHHDQHTLPYTLVYEFHLWHRHLTTNIHHLLHIVSKHKVFQSRKFHFDFLPRFQSWKSHPIRLVGCHKDLVCCHLKMSLLQGVYYICNPLTKQWLALPPAPGHHRLADTAIGFITSGDFVSQNSFKLVQIPELDSYPRSNDNCFQVNLFCSEVGEWRKFKVISPRSFTRTWQFRPDSVVFKNKFHWLVNGENVVVFDLSELAMGACRVVDLPKELNPDIGICLGYCQDYLTVCQIIRGWLNCVLVVWKLRDYSTGKWVLEGKFSLNEMVFDETNKQLSEFRFSSMEVLAFHPSAMGVLHLRFDNQIVICDVGRRTLEVVSECLQDSSFSVGTCGVFLLMHPCWPSHIPSLPLS